ncbi:MAG: hypothetical protein EXS69_02060 [Candidatus Zambryskibacteria bacterium]|nr:hypothetical protein [Candidatus Zambryskibacteria bacterium]
MKNNWQTKRVEEVCNVEYGTRVVRRRDGGSKYPVYGGGGETFAMDEYNREDRIVVARFAMSELCTRFIKGKFYLNDSGLTLSPKDESQILPEFLDLQTLALNDRIYSLARGTAQKNLDVPAFRNLEISFPDSIEAQKETVELLHEIFEKTARAKEITEKKLIDLDEFKKSVLRKAFHAEL